MNQIIAKSILALVACSGSAWAQLAPWPQVAQLDSPDVHFACNIQNVTFVYRKSSLQLLPGENQKVRALDRPAIVRASTPSQALAELFDYAIGYDVEFDPASAEPSLKLETANDLPFRLWHGVWSLYPTEGGFTGVPFQYHYFVRPDGKRIIPEIYFCDYVHVENHRYFSSLSFKEIEASVNDKCISADAAILSARDLLRQSPVLAENFQLRQVVLRELPFAHAAWGKDAFVYEIEFSNVVTADLREDGNPFSIWIATNGKCSTISVDRWTIEDLRRTKE